MDVNERHVSHDVASDVDTPRLAPPRAMSRCLALAWLACLAAILAQLFAPFEVAPARDEASSTLSCTACALILRDVSVVSRHAPRATLDDVARARDGDVDVDFKVRPCASRSTTRRSARATDDDARTETDGVFEQEVDALATRSIERACAPESAQRYDRRYTWLGDAYYVEDVSAPSGRRGRIDPALARTCRRLAKRSELVRDAFVRAPSLDARALTDAVCASDVIGCAIGVDFTAPDETFNLRRDWRRALTARVAIRVVPYFVVALFAPVLLLPSLYPPKPQMYS